MDFLKIDNHKNTKDFLEVNLVHRMLPNITMPTRIVKNSATLIDNIYTPVEFVNDVQSFILVTDISDHLPCFVQWSHGSSITVDSILEQRVLDEVRVKKICNELNNINIAEIQSKNASELYDFFITKIHSALDKYAPIRIKKCRPAVKDDPWFTKGLRTSSIRCDKMYKSIIGRPKNDPLCIKYRKYRNCYNKLKRKAKQNFFSNEINKYRKNSRKLWSVIKRATGKMNDKTSFINEIVNENGIRVFDNDVISNIFNDHFGDVGKKMATKIPTVAVLPDSFINSNTNNSLFLHPCTPQEIYKTVASLKNKRSSGSDGITNDFIKKVNQSICIPLCIIFNKSFEEGVFPTAMKLAKVVPLYKSGNKCDVSNYRPISLLPVMSKVLEKLVHKRLYSFLNNNDILYKSQYGFRSGYSTVDAVGELVGKIITGIDEGKYTLSVFLVLSKAFDSLSLIKNY
jgi:predicted CopG family antitoxin